MNCVNKSHPEFQELVVKSGLTPFEVEVQTLIWRSENNNNGFPLLSDLGLGGDSSPSNLDTDIKERIYSFISGLGLKVDTLDNYIESLNKRGKSFSTEGVNALIDLNNSVIALGKNASEYDFIEEAAHLGVAIMPESTQLNRALKLITETEQYKKNVEAYTKRYKELYPDHSNEQIEDRVRKEILGKLVADHLFTNQNQGISYRILRTIRALWNKLLGVFNANVAKANELNSYIESVTTEMLSNANRSPQTTLNTDGVYLSATEAEASKKLLNKIIVEMEDRAKSLIKRNSANKTVQRVRDTIDKLKSKAARAEEEKGLISFIEFVQNDLATAQHYVNEIRTGKKAGSAKQLGQLLSFIEYYMPLLREIKKKNNYSPLFTSFSKERQAHYDDVIRGLISALEDIEDFHDDALEEVAKEGVREEYENIGQEIDYNEDELFESITTDAWAIQAWVGKLQDLASPVARAIHSIVSKAITKVDMITAELGKDLYTRIVEDLGVVDTSVLAEKLNGKFTGFFLSRYKLAAFYEAYDTFFEELREKYDLEEGQREPYDPKQALAFRKEKNTWLSENTERLYTADYYTMQEDLSVNTREALLYIDVQIRDIENKVRTDDGNVDYYLLSDTDTKNLENLKIDRKRLAKTFHEDGTKKDGKELEIALELQAFYDKINKEREFDQKKEEFEKERKIAKARYTKEEYQKWLDANLEDVYDSAFWNIISNLEKAAPLSKEIEFLKDKKKQILSPFQNGRMEADLSKISEETLEVIKELDLEIQKLTNEVYRKEKEGKGSTKRKKSKIGLYATTEETSQFKKLKAQAKAEGSIKEFVEKHYYENYKGDLVPYSYGTHLVPIHGGYIKKEAKWKQLSKDSKFYNNNYDENWIGMQPSAKWTNSEYDKLTGPQRAALEELLKTKQEMDNKIPIGNRNAYMLPQMSKSFNDLLTGGNFNKDNIKELLADEIFSRVDDDEFGNPSDRIDGSIKNYVPVYFTKMLENPDNVSTDLVSSVIKYSQMANKYEQMSKVAPKLEAMAEQYGRTKYIKDDKVKEGRETNVYKMIQTFLEMQVYGKRKEQAESWEIPIINRKINMNKAVGLANSFVRATNLMFNTFTIATGYINGVTNSIVEDLVGKYTTISAKKRAGREYWATLPDAMLEFKKVNKSNKMNVMLEYFRVIDSFDDIFDNLDKDRIKRITKEDLVYFGYGMADYTMKSNIALAVLFNYRFYEGKFYTEANFNLAKEQGKISPVEKYGDLVSIYDMMEVRDYKFKPKAEFKDTVKESDLLYLDYMITNLATKADGTLSSIDRAKIHQSTWGQLAATHRGWLIDGISRRWKAKSVNLRTGEIEVGHHRELLNILHSTIMSPERLHNLRHLLATYNELEPYQQEAVRRCLLEMASVAVFSIIAKVINNAFDDEDDENWKLEALAYLSNRVLLETASLSLSTPLPGLQPLLPYTEVVAVLNSPVAGTKTLQSLLDINDLLFGNEEVERGPYKGMTKRQKFIMKQIPGIKGSMSLRDPSAANQFLKYSALSWLY